MYLISEQHTFVDHIRYGIRWSASVLHGFHYDKARVLFAIFLKCIIHILHTAGDVLCVLVEPVNVVP